MQKSLASTLLLLLSAGITQAAEIRGTLAEKVRNNQLVLETETGEKIRFTVILGQTEFRKGTAGQVAINDTWLARGDRLLIRHDENGVAAVVIVEWRWTEWPGLWVDERLTDIVRWSTATFGAEAFLSVHGNVLGLAGIVMVSLICGIISSLVMSNRMAFFSDALAHCAFAGVGLGLLIYSTQLAVGQDLQYEDILLVMIVWGALIGVGIAYVKERTTLANDTVIGVFFAGAMGFGAVLLKGISSTGSRFTEDFLFGDPSSVNGQSLVYLVGLLIGIVLFLYWIYNRLVFISFNPSLARSRNFPVRLGNYLFIVLLAVVVNVCLRLVGALLINALLIVPAATAANVCRNLRQFFWITTGLSVFCGVTGLFLMHAMVFEVRGHSMHFGAGGLIVMVGFGAFFLSLCLSRWIRGARPTLRTGF